MSKLNWLTRKRERAICGWFAAVAFSAAIIGGCSDDGGSTKNVGSKTTYLVNYEYVDNTRAVRKKYDEITAKANMTRDQKEADTAEILGFSYNKGDVCFIVMPHPNTLTVKELEKLIGHENMHCMFGRWHGLGGVYPTRLNIIQ